jgi:hypothetical protein
MLAIALLTLLAQQVVDPDFSPTLQRARWKESTGPRIAIDEAHHNFHTASGRYVPFAKLLRRDGYRVETWTAPFAALAGVDALLISNALHERNEKDWSLPTPSAFTAEEIGILRSWVEHGGALLLIADHMPWPGAAADLARAFGVEFSNGFAGTAAGDVGPLRFDRRTGLQDTPVTRDIHAVMTFTGSAFRPPPGAQPVLVFGSGFISRMPQQAWKFTPQTPSTDIEGWCQGALLERGKGRVAVFGEAGMFTAQLKGPERSPMGMNVPEASENARFIVNVMHWLTRAEDGIRPRERDDELRSSAEHR